MPQPSVIMSNGFGRYNLVGAAAELVRKRMLAHFITGAYPTGPLWRLAESAGLARGDALVRLARRGEAIPPESISTLWGAEAMQKLSIALRRVPALAELGDRLDVAGFRQYGRAATRILAKIPPGANIYHYRSGFGQESVKLARARGMVALCEHTIAHPRLLEYLVAHQGRMPVPGTRPEPNRFWRHILADLGPAEHVLVNSDFVKHTFVHQGWPVERVHVIYLGVDDQFLSMVPPRFGKHGETLRLLFAGCMEPRKGADVLVTALTDLEDFPWKLEIVGDIIPEMRHRHRRFFENPRVQCHGTLPRDALAAQMAAADVFVFPSLAEGSARVIFEALAAGCFVVTTANSGSIVEDQRHGFLVPAGDAGGLRDALCRAHRLGTARDAVGAANAALVRQRYRQCHYGDALEALYHSLLDGAKAGASQRLFSPIV